MLVATGLLAFATVTAGFLSLSSPQESRAAAACPFTDGDGGTSGIQVTGSVTVDADADGLAVGDFYDCTASFVEIKSGVTVTLQGDVTAGDGNDGVIPEIHFSDLEIESGASLTASEKGCLALTSGGAHGSGPNGSNVCTQSTAGYATGGGESRGGAGYGGVGGISSFGSAYAGGTTYGSATAPTLFGSSGGSNTTPYIGGNGGGVVRIDVSGTLTHDGSISANGQAAPNLSYAQGGGSGGSIYITAATLNGSTGVFTSSGGNGGNGTSGDGGGGGGGRIAIEYASGSFSFDSADFSVAGGSGPDAAADGAKGTVYVVDTQGTGGASDDDVEIYHGFTYTDTDYGTNSWVTDPSATNQYCVNGISSGATPSVSSPSLTFGGTLTCSSPITSFVWYTANTLTLSASAGISVNGALTLDGDTAFLLGSSSSVAVTKVNADLVFDIPAGNDQTWTNVTITGPAEGDFLINDAIDITLAGTSAVNANVQWTALNDLTIASTASINAGGKGCLALTSGSADGAGPNGSNVCTQSTAGYATGGGESRGGAGYGGVGGISSFGASYPGGTTYGSATAPTFFGSSGGSNTTPYIGGNGGGVVRIDVSGTLTHDGSISANGQAAPNLSYAQGGGSGGSIYITAATLNGSTGTFTSNGGNGGDGTSGDGGGGGGGRIAIEYASGSFSFDSADFSASGGVGPGAAADGAKGTVYVVDTQGTGGASDDDVKIYHGFTYTDTDYGTNSWVTDTSATNQYCTTSGSATPSITAATVTFGGSLSCSTSVTSFNLSATTDFNVSDSASFSVSATGSTIDWNIPAADAQTWTSITVTGAPQGNFTINDAVSISLAGTTAINANATWTSLASLTVASTASINATGKGCVSSPSLSNGYGPNGSNVCTISTAGYSVGGDGSGGGAGHGGSGGISSTGRAGGGTYGSPTAPVLFGSSAGSNSSTYYGGNGGGIVRIDVSGTLTHDGTISANGGNAPNVSYSQGGGSGGSVYITAGSYSCSTTPTFSSLGGSGGSGSSEDGGGGGGGRIAIEYENAVSGCNFNAGADTIGGSGASVLAAGGTGPDAAADGSAGTLQLTQTDDPPAVSSAVAATPSNPTVNQETTISATFTDAQGVNQIKLFLDGTTDPTNVIKTCTFAPAQSPASCSITIGPNLADGSHTIRATARDTASQTTNSDGTFTVGSFTTAGTMGFSRLKAGTANVDFSLAFDVVGPDTGPLVVTFPSGFTVTQAFTSGTCSGGGTIGSFGFTGTTLTGTKTGCIGTVSLSGAKVTLHSTPGTYTLTWTNDLGEGSFTIVDDDQVNVTGEVEQSLTFDLDVSIADTNSSAPYAISFGDLTLNTVHSSGTTVPSVWIDLSTNATGGAVITVRNVNGSSGLVSSGTPADTIPNAAAAMSSSTPNYGICVISVTQSLGGPLAKAGDYSSGTCAADGATNDVKSLTTANSSILSTTSDPVDAARARISVNVTATSLTPAHPDYADAITFIATATY